MICLEDLPITARPGVRRPKAQLQTSAASGEAHEVELGRENAVKRAVFFFVDGWVEEHQYMHKSTLPPTNMEVDGHLQFGIRISWFFHVFPGVMPST